MRYSTAMDQSWSIHIEQRVKRFDGRRCVTRLVSEYAVSELERNHHMSRCCRIHKSKLSGIQCRLRLEFYISLSSIIENILHLEYSRASLLDSSSILQFACTLQSCSHQQRVHSAGVAPTSWLSTFFIEEMDRVEACGCSTRGTGTTTVGGKMCVHFCAGVRFWVLDLH